MRFRATEPIRPGVTPLAMTVCSNKKCLRSSARSCADEYRSLARLAIAF